MFERHVCHLHQEYGPVHGMTFLHGWHDGNLDPEGHLLQVYQELVTALQHCPNGQEITLSVIDFGRHEKRRVFEQIPVKIGEMADVFLSQSGWTSVAGSARDLGAEVVREQRGVLRTNCRECVFAFRVAGPMQR